MSRARRCLMVAVARSFAVGLRHSLMQSAAEFELVWDEP